MMEKVKPVIWIGSSRRDLRSMPPEVRRNIGQALYTAQQGMTDPAAKPLKGFVGTRVMEIVERYRGDAYRAVYTAHFSIAIYVLHVFQKKSKRGSRLAKSKGRCRSLCGSLARPNLQCSGCGEEFRLVTKNLRTPLTSSRTGWNLKAKLSEIVGKFRVPGLG